MRNGGARVEGSATTRVACVQLRARDIVDAELALREALDGIEESARMGAHLAVLPECTYPAYVLSDPDRPIHLRDDKQVEERFASAARTYGIWIAVGLAQGWRPRERRAANAAILFDPDGRVRLRTEKRFLWDFDRRWFSPGSRVGPIDWDAAAGGHLLGMMICADARMPEIARSLTVLGARLILDPTAWVATGRETSSLSNPQPEYLMSVRAIENGVWIAAADKVGIERGAVVYAGRSCIVAPNGRVVAMASSNEPEVLVADIDLTTATGPPVARRPALYAAIAAPHSATSAATRAATSIDPAKMALRLGVLQSTERSDLRAVAVHLRQLATTAAALDLQLVVAAGYGRPEQLNAALDDLSSAYDGMVLLAALDEHSRAAAVVASTSQGHLVALPTHGANMRDAATLMGRTFELGPMRVGMIVGLEGLVPEVARVVALGGAELLVWVADADVPRALDVARVRAVENRIWTAILVPGKSSEALSAVVDPDGRITAVGLRGCAQLVVGAANVAFARAKEMAPGTHVITGRQPESYDVLVSGEMDAP